MANDNLGSKGQAWFCTTGLPSDVVIEVDDMSFHLHKFPLMSKSKKLHDLITDREQNPRLRRAGEEDDEQIQEEEEEDEDLPHITLQSFPGGSEAFEMAAKFCYGVKIDLTAANAAVLRCAAEYLEMSEEFSEENLVSRTDRFLTQSVLRSLKNSVKALKSCQDLLPLAEDLGIVDRCIESIASRSNSSDPGSFFGWPIKESSGREIKASKNGARSSNAGNWFEELAVLSLPIYKRVISAMKERDFSSEIIESSLISYAKRAIPGLSRSNRNLAPPVVSEIEQRELLEAVITNMPLEKSCGANTTRFLFRLLRTINILRASEASRTALERKIASQLETASLDDFLMPSYSYLAETLYDVESVERILGYYLEGLERDGSAIVRAEELGARGVGSPGGEENRELVAVGKLVDGYLAEIASDGNLQPDKFCDLAMALPDRARVYDDGLYRAVDLYLKAHPRISEEERERVCGVMDCRKLTLEACTHAAQNERLPLRAVVQVLFFEQLQLRHAIAGTLAAADTVRVPEGQSGSLMPTREGNTWRAAIRENQVLRLDMDSMRSRVHELERECTNMRKAIEKVDRKVGRTGGGREGGEPLARKFGCKFGTKVCDSHERTVMEPRRSQAEHQHIQ